MSNRNKDFEPQAALGRQLRAKAAGVVQRWFAPLRSRLRLPG